MPISAQALSQWTLVLPSEAKRSKLRSVLRTPRPVGTKALKPRLDWRTLKIVAPSLPQPASPGQLTGICDGRSVAFHCGFMRLKSWIASIMA